MFSPLPVMPVAVAPPTALPDAIRAALPGITVMLVNGALDFIVASIILILGWTIASWLARSLRRFLTPHTHIDETLTPLLVNFLRYDVLFVTLTAVLEQFGFQTTSLVAVVGAAGLATGLALQGTLSNVASGVLLLFLRPYRVTDKIVLSGITGRVQEVGLFRTELVTDDGLYVSIPIRRHFPASSSTPPAGRSGARISPSMWTAMRTLPWRSRQSWRRSRRTSG
jgi:small-conductance mechanosensitive channel